jgi:hypothetical protein
LHLHCVCPHDADGGQVPSAGVLQRISYGRGFRRGLDMLELEDRAGLWEEHGQSRPVCCLCICSGVAQFPSQEAMPRGSVSCLGRTVVKFDSRQDQIRKQNWATLTGGTSGSHAMLHPLNSADGLELRWMACSALSDLHSHPPLLSCSAY